MEYIFSDGRKVEVNDFLIPETIEDMFKVNLPSNYDNYLTGNGEGVWACGDDETLKAHKNDVAEGIYFVKILNDSTYYPALKYGSIIPVEMRGESRPVAIYDEIIRYGESKKDEVVKNVLDSQRDKRENKASGHIYTNINYPVATGIIEYTNRNGFGLSNPFFDRAEADMLSLLIFYFHKVKKMQSLSQVFIEIDNLLTNYNGIKSFEEFHYMFKDIDDPELRRVYEGTSFCATYEDYLSKSENMDEFTALEENGWLLNGMEATLGGLRSRLERAGITNILSVKDYSLVAYELLEEVSKDRDFIYSLPKEKLKELEAEADSLIESPFVTTRDKERIDLFVKGIIIRALERKEREVAESKKLHNKIIGKFFKKKT